MTGRPKRRRILEALGKRAVQQLGEDMDDGTEAASERRPLVYVEHVVASGGSLRALAAELSKQLKVPVSRELLSRLVNGLTPDAKEVLAEARRAGGHALVEEAQAIVDAAPTESRETLQKAKMMADTRFWRAERANPVELGAAGRGTVVNVTMQSLHLEALRAHALTKMPRPEGQAEIVGGVVKAIAATGR